MIFVLRVVGDCVKLVKLLIFKRPMGAGPVLPLLCCSSLLLLFFSSADTDADADADTESALEATGSNKWV